MYYNKNQLLADLERIVTLFGVQKPVGFFSVGEYCDDKLYIAINAAIKPAFLVFYEHTTISLDALEVSSDAGQHILQLALQADDFYNRAL